MIGKLIYLPTEKMRRGIPFTNDDRIPWWSVGANRLRVGRMSTFHMENWTWSWHESQSNVCGLSQESDRKSKSECNQSTDWGTIWWESTSSRLAIRLLAESDISSLGYRGATWCLGRSHHPAWKISSSSMLNSLCIETSSGRQIMLDFRTTTRTNLKGKTRICPTLNKESRFLS